MDNILDRVVELSGLNESFDKQIETIQSMTQMNRNRAAIAAGAKLLGDKRLHKKAKAVMDFVEAEGQLHPDIEAVGDRLYKEMMTLAKRKLKGEAYEKFYQAF